jgi:hypothetical protein
MGCGGSKDATSLKQSSAASCVTACELEISSSEALPEVDTDTAFFLSQHENPTVPVESKIDHEAECKTSTQPVTVNPPFTTSADDSNRAPTTTRGAASRISLSLKEEIAENGCAEEKVQEATVVEGAVNNANGKLANQSFPCEKFPKKLSVNMSMVSSSESVF